MDTLIALYYPLVGWWLLVGSLVFAGCVHEPFADKLLRQWTFIFAKPYAHGTYGHVFILWLSLLNVALGAFLVLAPSWDPSARQAVLIATNAGYALCLGLAIAGLRSPNYGPGLKICVALWSLLLAWGVAAMVTGA